jgi:hypothetical protein
MAKMRVHHWIACLHCEVDGPAGPDNLYNLRRVGYRYVAAPETEFPWTIEKLDLLARFFGAEGTRQFEVQVVWADAPWQPQVVATYGPIVVQFRPGDPVRDFLFRVGKVSFPGRGRYHVRLFEIRGHRLKRRATEYIEVSHQP